MRLRKDIPDELLIGAGVYSLDPNLGVLASQAAALLNRSKTRMDSDRRDSKPPPYYKDGSKVLYPLGGILALRAQIQGKSPEQAAREAADERRGWPSFVQFAAGVGEKEWPIAKVKGFPVDFFSTLEMDLEDDDLTDIEELGRDEFAQLRLAFYREKPSDWGVAPNRLGQEWAGKLEMATSLTEGWDKGYQQAIGILLTEKDSKGEPKSARQLKKERESLEDAQDYRALRAALDASPDSLYMTRFTAMLYLGMSPGVFKKALARERHPFGTGKDGATKGDIDEWFSRLMRAKHADEMPLVRPLRVGRDFKNGRPYLVDVTGVILADGEVSNIKKADIAYIASIDADLRILKLDEALNRPWRSPIERAVWATWRQDKLRSSIESQQEILRKAMAEDLEVAFGAKPAAPFKPF